jgi:hypothetical protein
MENQNQNNEVFAETKTDNSKYNTEIEVPETFQRSHISHVSHSARSVPAEMAKANQSGNEVMFEDTKE